MARKSVPSPDLYLIGGFAPDEMKTLRERFGEGASVTEGVSGRTRMEPTEFENTQTRGDIAASRNPE